MAIELLPRLIRFRDAPSYLGMNKHEFNSVVRPNITELKIGTIGVAFDRLDLDAWIEDYKSRSERPNIGDALLWGEQKQAASQPIKAPQVKRFTRSTNATSKEEFSSEVSRLMKKHKST